ncbi:MAG: glycosyltransferase [Enterococcaceae bacterium]|nr:glycosyltransferase [Enterococcaceae bacterium]MCI1919028.1 glycosyltransferase [Enterococcaceae bacterium]
MKVIHCLPGAMKYGGIEKVVMEIINGLGPQIMFGILAQGFIVDEYKVKLDNHKIEQHVLPIKSKNFKEYRSGFFEAIKAYDVVHIHAVYSFSFFEAKWALSAGKQVIFHSHNSSSTWKRKMIHYLLHFRLQKLENVQRVAVSQYAGKWMFGEGDFDIVFNGMDTYKYVFSQEKRKRFRYEYSFSKKQTVIGIIGRLDFQKDPLFSYKIVSTLCKKNNNYSAIFVGDGKYRDMLAKSIESDSLSNQIFMIKNTDQIEGLLSGIDIFLLPSRFEGLSIATVEAQISGLPCLLSNNVDPSTAINENVYFLSKNKINNWVNHLQTINKQSISRTIDLNKYTKFSHSTFSEEIFNLYKNVQ